MWRRSPERGIEGNIVFFLACRSRLDIAPMFALGLGERTPARMLARQFIERGIQPARLEFFARFDLLPAFPPICRCIREYILLHRLRLALLRTFLALIF